MAFKPLLDEWRESRQERAEMPMGERNAFMEEELQGKMTPGQMFWFPWLHADREAEAG